MVNLTNRNVHKR